MKNCPTVDVEMSDRKCTIVQRTFKKLSEKNRQRDNSLQPVVSKSGCETTNKVLSVKCYERQIVRRTIKNCLTDNLNLSAKNCQRDNSLQPVVSKSGCETTNKVLSVKCYERQIVRRTIKNCPTDNLKLSVGQKDKVLSVKCYERQIVRRTIKNCPTDNLKLSVGQKDKVLSVKCYERQIVRGTIKNCPTDNLKLSEKNRERDNSLQPVVSKSGCETTNEVLSAKCYERQIVRGTIKNCPTDNLNLSVGQKDKVLSVKCYERQIVRGTIKNCPTDNLKLSEKNRERDNSLQPVVSKSGCETTNEVLSVKCYERQIVRRTIKNCPTDNLKLSVGQKDKVLSVKCYGRQIVRRTIKNCPTDNLKFSEKNRQRDNSLQRVVSKSGCETTNKVLSVKCYERQIVRRTIKNCPLDNLKLSVGQKDKVRGNILLSVGHFFFGFFSALWILAIWVNPAALAI